MSSLARAFTLRRKKNDSVIDAKIEDVSTMSGLARGMSLRHGKKSVDVKTISGPLQLLSTTNMLSYNAPDVAVIQAQRTASRSVSSGSSVSSGDESDASSVADRSKRDTQLTDDSSVGSSSPAASPTSEKKHHFFESSTTAIKGVLPLRRSMSTVEFRHQSLAEESSSDLPSRSESPAIPQRHPSHSKRAHAELAKKRSVQGMSMSSHSRANSVASMSSAPAARHTIFDLISGSRTSEVPSLPSHPFGKELGQLDEVAEEFTSVISEAERAEDMKVMQQHDLALFCAAEYMAEIESLYSQYLDMPAMAWI